MSRIYVGLAPYTGRREVFRAASEPTEQSHGERFASVIGPFRTLRGAEFMRDYGRSNPHCQTVDDAERLAADLVLWGQHDAHGGVMLKIAGGTMRECRAAMKQRQAEGWQGLVILVRGEAPAAADWKRGGQ